MQTQPTRFYALLAWVSIMPIIGSFSVSTFLYSYHDQVPHELGFELFILLIAITFLMAFALTPTTFLAVVAGFLFKWQAIPIVVFSYIIAASIGYYIARFIDGNSLRDYIASSEKRSAFFNRLYGKDFRLTIFSRLSPVLPFAIMNVTLASLGVDFKKYLAGSIIGMLPRTLISIYIGIESESLVNSIDDGEWNIIKIIGLVTLLVISSWGIKNIVSNPKKI